MASQSDEEQARGPVLGAVSCPKAQVEVVMRTHSLFNILVIFIYNLNGWGIDSKWLSNNVLTISTDALAPLDIPLVFREDFWQFRIPYNTMITFHNLLGFLGA